MTIALVHGVPETSAVWDLLAEQLVGLGYDEPIRLSPPGFGAPTPVDWAATVVDYRDWLVTKLESMTTPVHLVGHDWGGCHVVNVAMTRPDLIRSWVSDVIGVFHPNYRWHERAQQWQQPQVGEEAIDQLTSTPVRDREALLIDAGMARSAAFSIAPAIDDVMGSCILRLYRSATQPVMADLGNQIDSARARPGLAILATEDDKVGTDEQRHHMAARAGARTEVLDGLGHCWMTHDPKRAAETLADFWAV